MMIKRFGWWWFIKLTKCPDVSLIIQFPPPMAGG